MSNDLVKDRQKWLDEAAKKDAQPVEKEHVQVSNDLVKDRQKWLDEAAKKDAQPVEKGSKFK